MTRLQLAIGYCGIVGIYALAAVLCDFMAFTMAGGMHLLPIPWERDSVWNAGLALFAVGIPVSEWYRCRYG